MHFLTPELTGVKKCTRAFFDTCQLGPSTRVVEPGSGNRALQTQQLQCLLALTAVRRGQQTNSTPLNRSMPHGCSMEKLRRSIPRLTHDAVAVSFHERYDVHSFWSWTWSNTQWSGTSNASLWNGPTVQKATHHYGRWSLLCWRNSRFTN